MTASNRTTQALAKQIQLRLQEEQQQRIQEQQTAAANKTQAPRPADRFSNKDIEKISLDPSLGSAKDSDEAKLKVAIAAIAELLGVSPERVQQLLSPAQLQEISNHPTVTAGMSIGRSAEAIQQELVNALGSDPASLEAIATASLEAEKPLDLEEVGSVEAASDARGATEARAYGAIGAPEVKTTKGAGVSVEQLTAIMPGLSAQKAQEVLPHLNKAMQEFGIDTPKRAAAFLAQLAHESGGLTYFEEIASGAAYEGRGDLGNTQPGDGTRYKGRGPIQLTGRANYRETGAALGVDLEGNPELAKDLGVAFRVAGHFWKSRGLNELADANHFDEITRRINGGFNGKADRDQHYANAMRVLGGGMAQNVPVAEGSGPIGYSPSTGGGGGAVGGVGGGGGPIVGADISSKAFSEELFKKIMKSLTEVSKEVEKVQGESLESQLEDNDAFKDWYQAKKGKKLEKGGATPQVIQEFMKDALSQMDVSNGGVVDMNGVGKAIDAGMGNAATAGLLAVLDAQLGLGVQSRSQTAGGWMTGSPAVDGASAAPPAQAPSAPAPAPSSDASGVNAVPGVELPVPGMPIPGPEAVDAESLAIDPGPRIIRG